MMISPSSIHFSSSFSSSRPSPESTPSYPPPSYAPPAAHFVIHHPSASSSSSTPPPPPPSTSSSSFWKPSFQPTSTFVHRDEDTIVPQLLFSRGVDIHQGTQEGFAMGPLLGSGGPSKRTALDEERRSTMVFGGAEERWALAAVFLSMALAGWNDSSIGPLMLAIGEHYKASKEELRKEGRRRASRSAYRSAPAHLSSALLLPPQISYLALSSVFICRFVGFSLAGMSNVFLNDRYG